MADEEGFAVERTGNTLLVALPEFSLRSLDTFNNISERLAEVIPFDDVDSVVVDLSRVAYAGTPLLAALVGIHLRARRRDKKFAVCSPTDTFLEVLHTVGLHKLLRIFPSRDAAFEAISATVGFYEG